MENSNDLRCRLPYQNKMEYKQLKHFMRMLKDRINQHGVSEALNTLQPSYQSEAEKLSRQESKSNLDLSLDGTPIHTLEQLITACNVDTTVWEVESFRTSTWVQKEAGEQLYSVRAKFKRTSNQTVLQYIDDLKKGLYQYKAPESIKRNYKPQGYCGIINIYDAHIDKMTVLSETGTESDIYKNEATFERHFDRLLDYLGSPEVIIFPIGNDFFNVNDSKNTTKRGTPQPTYIHFVDAFKIGLNLIRRCIDKARTIAPVYIPVVQGNHDEDLSSILGASLDVIYSDCSDVHIDDSRMQRKYRQYGDNMFMFDHGDKVKIDRVPLIMGQEQSAMWASTKYRYNFRGHCHHSQEYKITSIKETVGVEIHHLRALSQPSAWNVASGWIGAQKSTTAYKISRCGREVEKKVLSL